MKPVYIIAEAGVNHNGDLKTPFDLVAAAVNAKADIIKTINIGNNGIKNQQLFWAITISVKFNEPTHKSTQTITKPIDTS